MGKLVTGAALAIAIFLILLGMIFVIAGGLENVATGGIMILVAFVLILFVYRSMKIEAAKPTLVNQTFNVKMEGSGQLQQKQLQCKNCGAPLSDKDLTVISGGIMVKCPYCGSIYALEEAPKW